MGFRWVSGMFKLLLCTCFYLISKTNIIISALKYPSSLSPSPLPSFLSYANVSHSWEISVTTEDRYDSQSYYFKRLLYSEGNGTYPSFAFGVASYGDSNKVLVIVIIESLDSTNDPAIVWCANRDHPIGDNATLDLTSEEGLVLRDEDGSLVWSTNTLNLSANSIHLQANGNLILLNAKGNTIWESFDYPTDTLLNVKQDLSVGQRLKSTGMYYVQWELDGLHGYVDLNPSQEYRFLENRTYHYVVSQSLNYASHQGFNLSYISLTATGRLQWIDWNQSDPHIIDLFEEDEFGDCAYPRTCGNYGVCVNGTLCGCPMETVKGSVNYFHPINTFDPSLGCSLVNPLSCPDTHKLQYFLELGEIDYFDTTPTLTGTDVESCKTACLNQCSCKAVFFRHYNDTSFGNCTLPSEILTMKDTVGNYKAYNLVTFIKVQKQKKSSLKRKLVLSVSAASLIVLLFVSGVFVYVFKKRRSRAKDSDCSEDIIFHTVSRFSFEALKLATQDFQTRLGRGGFGSVFEGVLPDGTKVAVKQLDSLGQGRKEFLAEVNTIGSVHHFNLVRLLGFCDDGLKRLLVYEHMCNGSLEKWIFNRDISLALAWSLRQKIIHGVAAGLEYLHTHCKQNVIHFDIKPQNILLDKDFNIKISDFGLAKMVDRDQSQVMTMARGTPGYMAPELITGRAISVKVDVYSFGVLVLEIVCGRKNFGSSEGDCLTNLVKVKPDEDRLSDLIDEHSEGMQQHKEEVVKIMKIAIWCLQPHFIRPTMSMVVKVLQDLPTMEALSDLSYLTMVQEAAPVETNYDFSVRPIESILSGPR